VSRSSELKALSLFTNVQNQNGRLFSLLLLLASLAFGDPLVPGKSGLPSIDTLPKNEWDVLTQRQSYTVGLTLGALVPGGAQFYTKHNIRGGILLGLESYLLSEVLVNQALRRDKNLQQARILLAGVSPYADSMARFAGDPRYETWSAQFRGGVRSARVNLAVVEEAQGLWASQWAWLAGLHLYGLLDGYEMIERNRNGRVYRPKSTRAAVLWSLAIPGGGQWYNGSPGKAGLLYMGYLGSWISFQARQHSVEYYEAQKNLALAENDQSLAQDMSERATFFRKKRNQYIWAPMLFGMYSVADAAVDAMMSDFDNPAHLAVVPMGPMGPGLTLAWAF
jgi:TM2 domain-containing membrane protein YozV